MHGPNQVPEPLQHRRVAMQMHQAAARPEDLSNRRAVASRLLPSYFSGLAEFLYLDFASPVRVLSYSFEGLHQPLYLQSQLESVHGPPTSRSSRLIPISLRRLSACRKNCPRWPLIPDLIVQVQDQKIQEPKRRFQTWI